MALMWTWRGGRRMRRRWGGGVGEEEVRRRRWRTGQGEMQRSITMHLPLLCKAYLITPHARRYGTQYMRDQEAGAGAGSVFIGDRYQRVILSTLSQATTTLSILLFSGQVCACDQTPDMLVFLGGGEIDLFPIIDWSTSTSKCNHLEMQLKVKMNGSLDQWWRFSLHVGLKVLTVTQHFAWMESKTSQNRLEDDRWDDIVRPG